MPTSRKSLAGATLAALLAVVAAAPACAAYPERAITLIVPFSPAGGAQLDCLPRRLMLRSVSDGNSPNATR